ncbi:MAG: M23 family metallopeptidase [Acidimicrobiia bacterium]
MSTLRRLLAAAVTVAAVVPMSVRALEAPAAAQSSEKQQQLQQQLNENAAQTAAARQQLADAQAARQKLDGQLAGIDAQVAAATQRLQQAQADADSAGFVVFVLGEKAKKTRAKLDAAKDDVRQSALMLYTRGSPGANSIALLNAADGSGDIVEGKHYLQRINDKRQGDFDRVAKLQAQLDAQQADATAKKQQADAAKASAAEERQKLQDLANQQRSARDAAANAEAQENAAVGALRAQQDSIEADLQAESDRIAQLARDSGGGPVMGNGTFIWPVGANITSGFGYRTDPVTGAQAYHSGLDLGQPCGTPIKAAGTGVVISAGFNSGGYGNMTLINHGGGLSTLYGHQSSIIVSAGQNVTQGQVIGYVGSTGKSTGCHLHFEVRVNGNPVDPAVTCNPGRSRRPPPCTPSLRPEASSTLSEHVTVGPPRGGRSGHMLGDLGAKEPGSGDPGSRASSRRSARAATCWAAW